MDSRSVGIAILCCGGKRPSRLGCRLSAGACRLTASLRPRSPGARNKRNSAKATRSDDSRGGEARACGESAAEPPIHQSPESDIVLRILLESHPRKKHRPNDSLI